MDFTNIKKNLEQKEYKVSIFKTFKEAAEYLNKEIDGYSVGIGGSMTIKEIGLYELIKTHNTMFSHWDIKDGMDRNEIMKNAQTADIYLSSVNGISETGEIVNIDGTCNRVSGTLYGHKKVYFILGSNKIEETLDKAIYRARNVASPMNAKRFNLSTPCVTLGKCVDCNHPQRICKGMTILLKKPSCSEYEVVIIDEKLGF